MFSFLKNIISRFVEEEFNYDVCYSSPKLSPVDVLDIRFISDFGSLLASFGGASCRGMGNGINRSASSHDMKYYLPKAIEAVWVSLVDKKVYSVAALLPYDDIKSLFKANKELNRLDLCLLPEGKIMLYVKGNGWKILLDWSVIAFEEDDKETLDYICRSRGEISMKAYYDWYYSGEIKDYERWQRYLREKGNPSIIINRHLQRFNYDLNFEFEDNSLKLIKVWSPFSNKELNPEPTLNKGMIKMPARIMKIEAKWDDGKEFFYDCYMYFNEDEILDVFDEAYGDDRMQKGELKIKVSKYSDLFDISLNVGDKSIKFEKTEIRVFKVPIESPYSDGTLICKNYDGNHKNLFFDEEGYFEE